MDEVIEKLAAGDVRAHAGHSVDALMLVMLARILMTNMAIAEALAEMAPPDDIVAVESDKAGWGGLDG